MDAKWEKGRTSSNMDREMKRDSLELSCCRCQSPENYLLPLPVAGKEASLRNKAWVGLFQSLGLGYMSNSILNPPPPPPRWWLLPVTTTAMAAVGDGTKEDMDDDNIHIEVSLENKHNNMPSVANTQQGRLGYVHSKLKEWGTRAMRRRQFYSANGFVSGNRATGRGILQVYALFSVSFDCVSQKLSRRNHILHK
ncbi:hypothetical protein LXL04_039518 [Taraxacum kok-saghyz]